MSRVRLTVTAKVFIAVLICGAVALILYLNPGLLGKVAPTAVQPSSNIPPVVKLPDDPSATTSAGIPAAPDAPPGRTNWLTIGAVVVSLLIGTTVLMSSIVFSFQRYFEYQVEEGRKISQ